jgi:large subunit ribosomal protein L18
VGEKLAEKLLAKEIKQAVFDRNGYLYHGLVKSVADGVRKGGIKV